MTKPYPHCNCRRGRSCPWASWTRRSSGHPGELSEFHRRDAEAAAQPAAKPGDQAGAGHLRRSPLRARSARPRRGSQTNRTGCRVPCRVRMRPPAASSSSEIPKAGCCPSRRPAARRAPRSRSSTSPAPSTPSTSSAAGQEVPRRDEPCRLPPRARDGARRHGPAVAARKPGMGWYGQDVEDAVRLSRRVLPRRWRPTRPTESST